MLALGPISALDEIAVPFGVDPFCALVGEFGVQVVSICVVPSIIAVIGTVIRGVVGGSIALALAHVGARSFESSWLSTRLAGARMAELCSRFRQTTGLRIVVSGVGVWVPPLQGARPKRGTYSSADRRQRPADVGPGPCAHVNVASEAVWEMHTRPPGRREPRIRTRDSPRSDVSAQCGREPMHREVTQ
jgi:hypothetical protein